jgi:hypothetical protein
MAISYLFSVDLSHLHTREMSPGESPPPYEPSLEQVKKIADQ